MPRTPIARRLVEFARGEDGVITVQSLFFFMATVAMGAIAVDVTNVFGVRSQLQVAADAAAHAALFRLRHDVQTAEAATQNAIALVEAAMPVEDFGTVLAEEDVLLGWWDGATETFHARNPQIWDEALGAFVEGSPTAAMVTTRRERGSGNSVALYLFRVVGLDWMDVEATAVFTTYQPICLQEGFAANGIVDVQSNNSYFGGFCMHSNSHVSLNLNNFFEDGTVVSMPDLDDLVLPNSGLEGNPGLEEALHESYTYLHILDRIRTTATDPLWDAIRTFGQSERPFYVTNPANLPTVNVNSNTTLLNTTLTAGQVYNYNCNNANRTLTLQPGAGQTAATYSRFVLMTNCQIRISGKVAIENAVIYTTNTSDTSVQVNAGGGGDVGLWLGREDACAPGNGAQIITRGGFRNAAKLTMNGSRIVTLGNMNFAAQAVGVGASVVSDGDIDGSSNMTFTGCGVQADDPFQYDYFRAAY